MSYLLRRHNLGSQPAGPERKRIVIVIAYHLQDDLAGHGGRVLILLLAGIGVRGLLHLLARGGRLLQLLLAIGFRVQQLLLAGGGRLVLRHRAGGDHGGAGRGRDVRLAAGVRGMPCALPLPAPPLRIRRRRARLRRPHPRFPDPRRVFYPCSSEEASTAERGRLRRRCPMGARQGESRRALPAGDPLGDARALAARRRQQSAPGLARRPGAVLLLPRLLEDRARARECQD